MILFSVGVNFHCCLCCRLIGASDCDYDQQEMTDAAAALEWTGMAAVIITPLLRPPPAEDDDEAGGRLIVDSSSPLSSRQQHVAYPVANTRISRQSERAVVSETRRGQLKGARHF